MQLTVHTKQFGSCSETKTKLDPRSHIQLLPSEMCRVVVASCFVARSLQFWFPETWPEDCFPYGKITNCCHPSIWLPAGTAGFSSFVGDLDMLVCWIFFPLLLPLKMSHGKHMLNWTEMNCQGTVELSVVTGWNCRYTLHISSSCISHLYWRVLD